MTASDYSPAPVQQGASCENPIETLSFVSADNPRARVPRDNLGVSAALVIGYQSARALIPKTWRRFIAVLM